MTKLHVVNGSSVTEILAAAGIAGRVVEYADVLHEGPVPNLAEGPGGPVPNLDDVRADFLAACGWTGRDDARHYITEWMDLFARSADFDEVVLWYEHDLFDQLLLCRILDWCGRHPHGEPLSLVSPADYLGHQTTAQMMALFEARRPVTDAQLGLGAATWQAFTAPRPLQLSRLVRDEDTTALPHLDGALRRLLEEYPSPVTGLGRTEWQVLAILDQSLLTAFDLFAANARREERVFMGNTTFFLRLDRMLAARRPLIMRALPDGPLEITDNGRKVLGGEQDDVAINGIDRWIGGVHLTADNDWRWDGGEMRKA